MNRFASIICAYLVLAFNPLAAEDHEKTCESLFGGQSAVLPIVKCIQGLDASEQAQLSIKLRNMIGESSNEQEQKFVSLLIAILVDSDIDVLVREFTAEVLGQLEFGWQTSTTSRDAQAIYSQMISQPKSQIGDHLDKVLINGRNLYRDSMKKYVQNPKDYVQVAAQLGMFHKNYPGSSFAPAAHYYQAKTYFRAYHYHDQSIDELKKSNQILDALLQKFADLTYNKTTHRFFPALYLKAMNLINLGEFERAKSTLIKIVNLYDMQVAKGLVNFGPNDNKIKLNAFSIYIHRFFDIRGNPVVNRRMDARFLAQTTLIVLEKHLSENFNKIYDLNVLARELDEATEKIGNYFILFGISSSDADAKLLAEKVGQSENIDSKRVLVVAPFGSSKDFLVILHEPFLQNIALEKLKKIKKLELQDATMIRLN